MSKEEKDNKTSKDISDAAGTKPAALSDADLDNVAGGTFSKPVTYLSINAAFAKNNRTVK